MEDLVMSNNNYENGRYLPVLYTLPDFKLKIGSGPKVKYYVPELDTVVPSNAMARTLRYYLDISPQQFYNRHFLRQPGYDNTPKCPYCGKDRKFINLYHGYYATCCSNECKSKLTSEISSRVQGSKEARDRMSAIAREVMNRPGMRDKLSKGHKRSYRENPDLRRINSEAQKRRYELARMNKGNKTA